MRNIHHIFPYLLLVWGKLEVMIWKEATTVENWTKKKTMRCHELLVFTFTVCRNNCSCNWFGFGLKVISTYRYSNIGSLIGLILSVAISHSRSRSTIWMHFVQISNKTELKSKQFNWCIVSLHCFWHTRINFFSSILMFAALIMPTNIWTLNNYTLSMWMIVEKL